MFNNPFIHARTASDYVIGLLIAIYASVVTSLFLALITQ